MTGTYYTTAKTQEVAPGHPLTPVTITVNDRAATREAIIRKVRELGHGYVSRSAWGAVNGNSGMERDWTLESWGHNTTNTIPAAQIDGVVNLVEALKSVFVIKHFGGHREYPGQLSDGKICPGNVGMELVRAIRSDTDLLIPPSL